MVPIETLLDLDGGILEQERGYWVKTEVRRTRRRSMLHMASGTA
jgi:hypothetical protein